MSTRQLQYLLASVFFGLGGWCVAAPASVVSLGFRPEYRSAAPIVPILVVCFGAQALLSGLFAAASRFTRWTFGLYGVALIPFFVGDFYFYLVKPMLTEVGLLDLVGNLIMLAVCIGGWRQTAPALTARRSRTRASGPTPGWPRWSRRETARRPSG